MVARMPDVQTLHSDHAIEAKVVSEGVNVFYGDKQALYEVSLDIPRRAVTALIEIGRASCRERV